MIKRYGNMVLANILAEHPADWDVEGASHVRVQLPATAAHVTAMQRTGFFWVDRTLKTTIVLNRCKADLDKLLRLPVVESAAYRDDIFRIACASFTEDRRFHLDPDCSAEVAALVLRETVDTLGLSLVCLFHDKAIGFLTLKKASNDTLFVHLAAVEEQYRMTGAAMSLYAAACKTAREQDFRKLEGRISSRNTAVMNVYSSFGASFSDPMDIFLKKVRHDS